jgi:hypothetical protein
MAYNIFTQLSQNDDITSLTGTECGRETPEVSLLSLPQVYK